MRWIDAIQDWMHPARIPGWVLREMCLPNLTRYELGFPFRQAGKAYATNGAIAIEIDKQYGAEPTGKTPNLEEMFANYWTKQGAWFEWRGLPESTGDKATCLTCFGRAVQGVYLPCPRCGGEQYVWTTNYASGIVLTDLCVVGGETKYLVECPDCVAGYSGKPCSDCNGTGAIAGAPDVIRIDSRLIDRKYFYLISCLPDAEFVSRSDAAPRPDMDRTNMDSLVVFQFQGGRGLLQPVTQRGKA